jgi:hypothetical protein
MEAVYLSETFAPTYKSKGVITQKNNFEIIIIVRTPDLTSLW